jgi:hypothetical protein
MNAKNQRMLLCAVAAALPALLSPQLAMSASTNPTVTVVNTTANPVPVSGSITVGNSVVPVEVSNADPILVKTTDGTPFYQAIFGQTSNTNTATGEAVLNIPAGKALVLSKVFVTGQLNGTCGGVQSVQVSFPYGGGKAFYDLSVALLGTADSTSNYRSDTDLPWKFLPGDTFQIRFSAFGGGCVSIFTTAQLLGRLIDQ